jgi:hypothetical protein
VKQPSKEECRAAWGDEPIGSETIHESAPAVRTGRIDAKTRTIHDVAVLGRMSKNNREYSDEALGQALTVLEGAKVFLNHEPGAGGRDVRDYVGRITGLYQDGDTVRARDLQINNASHWELLQSVASDPNAFGLSVDVQGEVMTRAQGQPKLVTKITGVSSVDLVAHPATNQGLFESVGGGRKPTLAECEAAWNS